MQRQVHVGSGRAWAYSGFWKATQAPGWGRGKGLPAHTLAGITESEMEMGVDWLLTLCQCSLILVQNTNTTKEELLFRKVVWLSILNFSGPHDSRRPFPSCWADLSSVCVTGEKDHWGLERSIDRLIDAVSGTLSVPTVAAQDAAQTIIFFHIMWICRFGVWKANFHF